MAKVYSWSLGQGEYAYIANPNNLDSIYVGPELNGNNLKKVSDWVQNCSDTLYDDHFYAMVQEVRNRGYSTEFESAESYRTLNTTCDNLRGPAGRGISSLKIIDETNPLMTVYAIVYDDNTYDTFNVYHGQNGTNGRDGNPGPKGDSPVATRTMFVYKSGKNGDVERPKGGSWDYITNVFTPPSGWGSSDGLEHPVYQSTRTFASDPLVEDPEWSEPMLITGENGLPGVDGVSTEFIYFQMPIMPPQEEYPDTSELESRDEVGFVPSGWSASPMGVDEDNKVEFVATRRKEEIEDANGNKISYWGSWSKASVWSHFGSNGQDGDGVQYIYLRNKGEIVLNPTPLNYLNDDKYQEKDTEWLPTNGTYTNIDYSNVTINENNQWTDDPKGVDEDYQFEWVAQRKYRKGEDGTQKWQAFSKPTLWAKFGESGSNGTSVRTMYCWTKSTSEIPNIPNNDSATNLGGEWQLNFPTRYDYNSGENVVWGITGTIYAHNNEFVKKYTLVSKTDTSGNVIPPEDYYNNYVEKEYLPSTEQVEAKYVLYNKEYYEWKGGWDGPYLITGTKGNDGTPMDYNTIAFCYGPKDFPPQQPPTNISSKSIEDGLVSSLNEKGDTFYWYDFPKTELGLDGEEKNGYVMRWYQCAGSVYSENQLIYKWGAVTPNSPMDGETLPGKYMEFRFAVTPNDTKPTIDVLTDEYGNVVRYPKSYLNSESKLSEIGWFTTDTELPAMTKGSTMWQIWAWIDGATNEVEKNQIWQGPTRVSGEKGEQGEMGPIGKRGVTGIPGANYNQMYCLGTETVPFGHEEWISTGKTVDNREFGPKKKDFSTWFTSPPSSVVLNVTEESKLDDVINITNKGRVIHYHIAEEVTIGGSSFIQDKENKYYLINQSGNDIIDITDKMEFDDEGNTYIYIWCIQGSDVWEAGAYAGYVEVSTTKPKDADESNTHSASKVPTSKYEMVKYIEVNGVYYQWIEIEGENVQHKQLGIEWSEPFRIQGVSGLRGISGSRGQVVYPMGVYNENEVYITTKEKAPYVYDTSAGMFYVLNMVDQPWVGRLPENPDDWAEDKPYYQTITIGNDTDGNPIYKYMHNGQWITTDQKGDTPGNNFANAEKESVTPAWVMFESFEALYTNIGIIENGMIGSAVYNNEFMFSQQGINRAGAITNYATESAKPPINSGFLSAYEWDETGEIDKYGEQTGRHWKYRGSNIWLDDKDVNPYEEKNITNQHYFGSSQDTELIEADLGTPIHTFRPNVCINFKTGEMWTSAGKVNFDADGSGYLLNRGIIWDYVKDENNESIPYFRIGDAEKNGITFSGSTMFIGPLEEYKDEMVEALSNMDNKINDVNSAITQTIEDLGVNFQKQIDSKCNTWYQENDPCTEEKWQVTDIINKITFAEAHIGDMWYKPSVKTSYVFSSGNTEGLTINKEYINVSLGHNLGEGHSYYWRVASIPMSVYDTFDGKTNIYVNKPSHPYHVGDMWLVENNNYKNQTFADSDTTNVIKGTMLIAVSSSTGNFKYTDWSKKDRYTDDTTALAAQAQLELWSTDGLISPTERESINNIGKQIIAEYPGITGQADTYNIGDTNDVYRNYMVYTQRATATTDYYSNSENCNSGDTIILSSSTHSNSSTKVNEGVKQDYSNIERYYSARAALQNLITNTVYNKSTGLTANYFASANTYTNTQINAISSATKTLISGAQETLGGLIDGKASTYAQSGDPSSSWGVTTGDSNYVGYHEGDVWYNTNSGTTQIFSSTQGEHYIISAFSNKNTGATKYYWNRTDMPLEVFDYSDGKSSIYTNNSKNGFTGYTYNDMWVVPSNANSNLGKWSDSTGVTLVCTKITTSGTSQYNNTVIATAYNANDWVKLDKYTDDTFAKNKFNAWANDGWISPAEMRALKDEAEAIALESSSTSTAAVNLGLSGTNSTYDTNNEGYKAYTAYTAYTVAAYNTAKYYSNTANTNTTDSANAQYQCIKISGTTTSDISSNKAYANIAKYYECREKLQNAIVTVQAEKTKREAVKDAISGATGSTQTVMEQARNDIASQLGYGSYADMVSMASSTGKIITDGGYLSASLIDTEDLIAASINTRPKQDATENSGRITISNNVIDVYRNNSSSPVLKITGEDINAQLISSHTLTYTCEDATTSFSAVGSSLSVLGRKFNVIFSKINLYNDDNLHYGSDVLTNIVMTNVPSYYIWISGITQTGGINILIENPSQITNTTGFTPTYNPGLHFPGTSSPDWITAKFTAGSFTIDNNKGGKFYASSALINDTTKHEFRPGLLLQASKYGGSGNTYYHKIAYSLVSDTIDLSLEDFVIGVEFINGNNTVSYTVEPKINLLQIGKNGMILQTTGSEYIDFSGGEDKTGYTIHSNNNAIQVNSSGVNLKIDGVWYSPVINGSGTARTLTFAYMDNQ